MKEHEYSSMLARKESGANESKRRNDEKDVKNVHIRIEHTSNFNTLPLERRQREQKMSYFKLYNGKKSNLLFIRIKMIKNTQSSDVQIQTLFVSIFEIAERKKNSNYFVLLRCYIYNFYFIKFTK